MNILSIGQNWTVLSKQTAAACGIIASGVAITVAAVASWRWAYRPTTVESTDQEQAVHRPTPPTGQVTQPSTATPRSSVPTSPPLTTPKPQTQTESTRGGATGDSELTTATSTPDATAGPNQINTEAKVPPAQETTPDLTTTPNNESPPSVPLSPSSSMQPTTQSTQMTAVFTTNPATVENPSPASPSGGSPVGLSTDHGTTTPNQTNPETGETSPPGLPTTSNDEPTAHTSPSSVQADQHGASASVAPSSGPSMRSGGSNLGWVNGSVQFRLGREAFKEKPSKARAHFEKGVEKHNNIGCRYQLALMCMKGKGGDKDIERAIELLKPLLNWGGGLPQAAVLLGKIMREETKDLPRARAYFGQAAQHDFSPGQYYLALMCRNGEGESKDAPRARGLFEKASGHIPSAHLELAEMLMNGEGVKQNLKKAKEHCQKALKETSSGSVRRRANRLIAAIARQPGAKQPRVA